MFGPLRRDRRALLALAGLVACGAYVTGGLAVAEGLADAATDRPAAALAPPRLAWEGPDPFTSEVVVPEDLVVSAVRIAPATVDGRRVVVAHVLWGPEVAPGVPPELGDALGPLRRNGTALPATDPHHLPRTWVYVNATTFAALAPGGGGTVLVARPEDADRFPPGLTVADAAGYPSFTRRGLEDAGRAALLLSLGTSLVVLVLARNFLAVAVASRAQDLKLVHTLGESRRRLEWRVLRWTVRLAVLGLLGGAALGLVLANLAALAASAAGAAVSLSPGISPGRLALAVGLLLAASIGGAILGARRAVARVFGQVTRESRVGAAIGASLLVAVFVGTQMVLAGALAADWLYGEGEVIAGGNSPIPTHSRLPASLGADLVAVGAVRTAAPEVVAFTSLDGSPVTLRGSVPAALLALHGGRVVEGALPTADDEIALGRGLAGRLDLAVGDRAVLTPMVHAGLHPVTVVGIVEAPGILREEGLTTLPLARTLAHLSSSTVHVLEVLPADRPLFAEILANLDKPALRVLIPLNVTEGPVVLRTQDADGAPLRAARVTVANRTAATGADGAATLNLPPGVHTVFVRAEGHRLFFGTIEVAVNPANVVPERLVLLPAEAPRPPSRSPPGGSPPPGGSDPAPPPQPEPDSGFRRLDSMVHGGDGTRLAMRGGDDPLGRVFGNILAAILSVVILSTLLLTLGLISIYARHVHERREDLALVRNLGASRRQLAGILAGRLAVDGGLVALAGLAGGTWLAHAFATLTPLVFFGHALPFSARIEPFLVALPLLFAALFAAAWAGARPLLRPS